MYQVKTEQTRQLTNILIAYENIIHVANYVVIQMN